MSRRSLPLFLAIMALTTMSVSVWAKNDSGDTITTFVIDNNKLTEIQVSGKTKAIEFSSGM